MRIKGRTEAAAWKRLADALGLARGDAELFGSRDGENFSVRQRRTKSHGSLRYYTTIEVPFDVSLKRGLVVWHVAADRELFAASLDQVGVSTGTRIDWGYRVFGRDPEATRSIVTHPDVERLLAVDRGRFTAYVCDHFVRIECPDKTADISSISAQIVDVIAIVRAVRAANRAVAMNAEAMKTAAVWQPICEAAGLTYEVQDLRGSGQLDALGVRVEAVLDKQVWRTEVEVTFSPRLDGGLSIWHQGLLETLFGVEELNVGLAEFDPAFVVHGNDPRRVREILTPEACTRLLALREPGQLTVTDHHVIVRVAGIVSDPAQLTWLLENVVSAARAMLAHRANGQVGPYR